MIDTKKIDVINEAEPFVNELKSRPNGGCCSWDHCRRAFRRAAYNRNPDSSCLPKLTDCEYTVCGDEYQGINCRLCDNNLALNLMTYLASWETV